MSVLTSEPAWSARPAAPRPRTWMVVVGVIVLVAGLGAGVGLWLAAEQRYDDGVAGLARAAVGCETVVSFDERGDFLVFAESAGRFDPVAGSCPAEGAFRADVAAPGAAVEVVAPDGEPASVAAASGADYDRGGSRGAQIGVVRIDEPGDHVVRVSSADGEFAVALGDDPLDGVVALRMSAVAAIFVGVVVGLVLIVLGRRPRPAADPDLDRTAPAPPAGPSWLSEVGPSSPPWPTSSEPPAAVVVPPVGPESVAPAERPTRPIMGLPAPIPGQPAGPGWRRPEPESPSDGSPWAPPHRGHDDG